MCSVCTLHALKSALGGSDKGIVLNDLALIFKFGVIFKNTLKANSARVMSTCGGMLVWR